MCVILALLASAGLGSPAQASTVQPGPDRDRIGIQLLEAPASRRGDPRALRYIVDHVRPGTVIKRKIRVINRSAERQRLELYAAAATITRAQFTFTEGRASNELTPWISLDRDLVDLKPGEDAQVHSTITVPETASAGERYAVIWASTKPSNRSSQITQVHRVGIRVYLHVGPGGEPPSDFTIGQITPARAPGGEPSASIAVTNTGGRALDMTGTVALSEGPAGMRAGPFDITRGTTLAPGESGVVSVAFPADLPNGPWRIEATLESGMVKHTASGTITFPDPGRTGKASSLRDRLSTPLVIVGASLIAGLLALVVFGLARRHRRSAPGVATTPHHV
ncbi:hypothetical protein ABZ570_03340 [Micromonospora sp. NPDC007271]|uniref:hypothetical protein n=1 Tax=Micromonospora sp. NPDC007271 TaxID=3154587 RepID=UPI0033F1B8A5